MDSEEIGKDKVLSRGLWISRVPPKTKELFKLLALDEFEDDYGMTLKYLLDKLVENENTNRRFEELDNRLKVLENNTKETKEPKKTIKTVAKKE